MTDEDPDIITAAEGWCVPDVKPDSDDDPSVLVAGELAEVWLSVFDPQPEDQ